MGDARDDNSAATGHLGLMVVAEATVEHSSDPLARRGVASVCAPLPYLARSETPPFRYVVEPPPGIPKEVGSLDWQTARIHSGWTEAASLMLDEAGLALVPSTTRFLDWWSDDAIRAHYYPEMVARVLALTGGRRALAFDHNVRFAPRMGEQAIGKPARLVHNDFTSTSAPQRVRDLLGASEASSALNRRFAMINLWRPIHEPLRDAPLALCDARSVAPADVVVSALIYPDRRGEILRLTWNPAHRWVYFPDMRTDEMIAIKCWDSATDGRAVFSAHTAFDDPACPPDEPPRQSIEVRTLVLW